MKHGKEGSAAEERSESKMERKAEGDAGGHGARVKGAIAEHQAGHLPFPTMHPSGSSKGTDSKFLEGSTSGGSAKNDKDTGFANKSGTG